MFSLGCPLPPHPWLKLLLSPLPTTPTRPLYSPEEIKVDGGELALDEGPECPEEVRCLDREQNESARQPLMPVMNPMELEETVTLEDTELGHWPRHDGVSLAQVRGILEVKSLDCIWGLHSLKKKAEFYLPQ